MTMIRKFNNSDMEQVLSIWLEASIVAHDFIDASFWQSQLEDMREKYLPAAETFVYEDKNLIVGFISLYENTIAAVFISPDKQTRGIGTQLINHVKKIRSELDLKVYKQNKKSINFYKKNGFKVVTEQIDEHTGRPEMVMKWGNF